jgi:hypothetical protein
MKNVTTDGIVADGADRLRKALASKDHPGEAPRESLFRRIVRRLLCQPSNPKRDAEGGGPSPYSLFGAEPKKCRSKKTDAQQAAASDGDKPPV